MNKKKIFMIGGGLLVLIVIIVIISLISSTPQPATQSGNSIISKVVLAKNEDANKNPINATNIFSVNDSDIHAVITINGLPANQSVDYQWFDVANNNVLKDDKRQNTAVFSGVSDSVLTKSDQLTWGVGSYEFRVIINNVTVSKNPYSVMTDADIQQAQIISSIQSVQLTNAVDVLGNPTGITGTVFSTNDENIFASISYQNMPVQSEFVGRWTYLDEDRLIETYQKNIIGTGTFAFGIDAKTDSWLPIKKWPAGRYDLKVSLNGDQIKDIQFTIQ